MSKVEQTAGDVGIAVYTDGYPLWPDIKIRAINGDLHEIHGSIATLHDLRYCIDRVLAQLGDKAR